MGSGLYFQETPASDMDQTALLTHVVSLRRVYVYVESQAPVSSACLSVLAITSVKGNKSSFYQEFVK